jgi:putative two-component system response regulator
MHSESRETTPLVLLVDDDGATRSLLSTCLRREGVAVHMAADGAAALDIVAREHPDLVLLDVLLPKLSGLEACRLLKSDPATRLLPVVLITGLTDSGTIIRAIEAGADDFFIKPFRVHEICARVRSLVAPRRYGTGLDKAEAALVSLAVGIEAKRNEGHCERVATGGVALGDLLGLSDGCISALWRGGLLHDVGKVAVPSSTLDTPGPLAPDELAQMRLHTVVGDALCRGLSSQVLAPIARSHHERIDGSGYPDGLVADDIPLLAQIVAVVDCFDALTSHRPFRPAMTQAQALEELTSEVRRGRRRRDLVDAWTHLVVNSLVQSIQKS